MDRSEFLNQYPCIPSAFGVFQFGTFLSVAPSESRCIFTFGPPNSFPILLIHSAVLLCSLRSPYFAFKFFFLYHPIVGLSSCILPLLAGSIFSLFWNVLFCLHCLILSRYLFSPFSFASSFCFISSCCIDCLLVLLLFYFPLNIIRLYSSVFSFLHVFVFFVSAFPDEYPIQVITFSSCSGSPIFTQTNFAPV